MAAGGGGGAIGSLQLNHNLNYVFTSIDPTSLLLSQFSSHNSNNQPPSSSAFIMQRGPRYEAYAALRESKLRMKLSSIQEKEDEDELDGFNFNFKINNSQQKLVKSNSITQHHRRSKGPSPVSVQEFTTPIKRENRRLSVPAAVIIDQKPTIKSKSGTYDGIMGRKSVEKKSNGGGGGFMGKKSYASLEVLKGLGSQARRAINGGESLSNTMSSFPRRNCNLDRSEFGYSTHF